MGVKDVSYIALPCYGERVLPRYGLANSFAVCQVDTTLGTLVHTVWRACPDDPQQWPLWLQQQEVAGVLCGGIHPRFQQALLEHNLWLRWGLRGPVTQVVADWLAGCCDGILVMPGQTCTAAACCFGLCQGQVCVSDNLAKRRKDKIMKICVSSTGAEPQAQVDGRFGRAAFFLVYDKPSQAWTSIDNSTSQAAAQGAGVGAAQRVIDAGVQVVLTGNVGPKAYRALEAAGVAVVTGAEGTVAEAVEAYEAGRLQPQQGPSTSAHAGQRGGRR